jgi:nucleoside-diphosphate-sugar epimerase
MSLTDKRVFVTGATGFIGGALTLRLAEEGARVTALARTPSKAAFLTAGGVEVAQGDVTDRARMRELVAGHAIVFHLAAVAGAERVKAMQAVNVEGAASVLAAARAAGVERFVHVSSISVYGYARCGVVDESVHLFETGDMYGDTKAIGEGLVKRADLPWTVVRPGQVYGPRGSSWTLGLFNLVRGFAPLVDGGHGSTHPIYIDDLVELLVLAATHPAAPGEVFNGTPDPASDWRTFLMSYAAMRGHSNAVSVPLWALQPPLALFDWLLPLTGRRLPVRAMLNFMCSDLTYSTRKARDLLGWRPRVDLDEGMRRTEAWLRAEGYL